MNTKLNLTTEQRNQLAINLAKAFRALRKLGYIARQNYMCCSSCAGYSLTCDAENLVKNKKPFKGVVFFHRQDAKQYIKGYSLAIRFGHVTSEELGELGQSSALTGKDVVRVFAENGLVTKWDGNPNVVIEVVGVVPPAPTPEPQPLPFAKRLELLIADLSAAERKEAGSPHWDEVLAGPFQELVLSSQDPQRCRLETIWLSANSAWHETTILSLQMMLELENQTKS